METSELWTMIVACLAAAVAVAALGGVMVMARRVADVETDVTEALAGRKTCPDRPRIDALEDYASAGNGSGRHGRQQPRPGPPAPRTRWTEPPPDQWLLDGPPLIRRPADSGGRRRARR